MRDFNRIVLPPASFIHEKDKMEKRWPAAVEVHHASSKLNEFFGPEDGDVGIVLQGGMYNGVIRALQQLGLADVYGDTRVPLYVLNVTYPLVDDEVLAFCAGKSAVLVVEEGQPEFIEQALNTILRRPDVNTRISGKDVLPDGRRIHRHGDAEGPAGLPREACAAPARQPPAAARCLARARTARKCRRWPASCRRARRASAPAARSARSSPR